MPTVLLSSPTSGKDISEVLESAGFAVIEHALGAVPPVEFGGISVAVIDCGERIETAAAQTRRWRAELGDDLVPIVWVIPDADRANHALDSGADAVLFRPIVAAVLVAQVKSAARLRSIAQRVSARAAETRMLGEQLHKAHARIDRELTAVQRARHALLPRAMPAIGRIRFAVNHRPRTTLGGDFYDVRASGGDRVLFFLTDIVACSTAAGMLGVIAAQAEAARAAHTPAESLVAVNHELLNLTADDRPLVAMLAGSINTNTGELVMARAGLPAPAFVPDMGEPETWTIPGPFLGSADVSFPVRAGALRPGDKLVIGTDGMRADDGPSSENRLLGAATRHRALSGQGLVDAIARDLLADVRHEDDFTVMVVEMAG